MLRAHSPEHPKSSLRRAAWILGDQLSLRNSALLALQPSTDIVIMIESLEHAQQLQHHKAKLYLCFSAMRHFREELRSQGYTVCYYELDAGKNFLAGLQAALASYQIHELLVMEPNDIATVRFAQALPEHLGIEVRLTPSTMFLTDRAEFIRAHAGKLHLVMEHYYRKMRKHFKVLLTEDGKPIGGQWNFDRDNRHPLNSKVHIPKPYQPTQDDLDREVIGTVEKFFPHHIGSLEDLHLPTTRLEAEKFFEDFIQHRLADFGKYEDAMLKAELVLFHSQLSPLLNIGLLDVMTVVRRVEQEYFAGRAPLNSVEGFIRQIIGWREFMYGCYWLKMSSGDYHAENYFGHTRPLPDFFWTGHAAFGRRSMNCLSSAICKVIRYGYTHHIERLMIIGNFALLAGIQPSQINRWFWEFYIDAYDWVVSPNVIGMSQFADGGFVATKPYCASANYIDKMSDYCKTCDFNKSAKVGESACPFNYLYWNFFIRHEALLRRNLRISMVYLALDKKSNAEKLEIQKSAAIFLNALVPNRYYA
jgi:deoxyribodipyrimidine photolyase-related protein